MNGKHTPGPWSQDKYGNVISADKETIKVEGVSLSGRSTEETRANARLIAAAPELLAALEAMLEAVRQNIDGIPPTADQIFAKAGHSAVAAIAKATGTGDY